MEEKDWKSIREKNALIAELAFNEEVYRNERGGWSLGPPDYYDDHGSSELFNPLPNYYDDIKEAWSIVEEIRDNYCVFSLVTINVVGSRMEWLAKWEFHNPEYEFVFATSKSAPEAICEATLKLFESLE